MTNNEKQELKKKNSEQEDTIVEMRREIQVP